MLQWSVHALQTCSEKSDAVRSIQIIKMIKKDKVLEEEKINKIIENVLEKVIQIIMAYNLRDKDTEEAMQIRNIQPKLEQFLRMYANEYALIKKDTEQSPEKIKQVENVLLEQLEGIMTDLERCRDDINKMLKEASAGASITREYEDIHRIYGDYIKRSKKLDSDLHMLEHIDKV